MTRWNWKLRQHESTLKYIISGERHWSYTFHQKKASVWSLLPTNKTIWNVLCILGSFLSSFTKCIAYAKRKQWRLNKYMYILSAESYNNPFTLMRLILLSKSQSLGQSQLLHSPSFYVLCHQDIKPARKLSYFLFTEKLRPLSVSVWEPVHMWTRLPKHQPIVVEKLVYLNSHESPDFSSTQIFI